MVDFELSLGAQNEMIHAMVRMLDRGRRNGTITMYEDREDRSPVGVLRLSRPAFGAAKSGIVVANPVDKGVAIRTARLGYAVAADSDGGVVFTCAVGESNATMIVENARVEAGGVIEVLSLTFRMPRRSA